MATKSCFQILKLNEALFFRINSSNLFVVLHVVVAFVSKDPKMLTKRNYIAASSKKAFEFFYIARLVINPTATAL